MAELHKTHYGIVKSSPKLLVLVKVMEVNECQTLCITLALFRKQLEQGDYANAVSSINYSPTIHFNSLKFEAHIQREEFEAHLTRSRAHFESR